MIVFISPRNKWVVTCFIKAHNYPSLRVNLRFSLILKEFKCERSCCELYWPLILIKSVDCQHPHCSREFITKPHLDCESVNLLSPFFNRPGLDFHILTACPLLQTKLLFLELFALLF